MATEGQARKRPLGAHVLRDRIDMALSLPERVGSWHWLHEGLTRAEQAHRLAAVALLQSRRPAGGWGGFLCATLLDSFVEGPQELGIAADIAVREALPIDAGVTLVNVAFARCLREAHSIPEHMAQFAQSGALQVLENMGSRLCALPLPMNSRPPASAVRRVAVIAPSLSTAFHAPTVMALAHASALVDQGLEVEVFSAQESMMARMHEWLGTPRRMLLSEPDNRDWPRPRSGGYAARRADTELSMQRRYLGVLHLLARFDPDACLFVGAYSPLLWPVRQHWPTIGVSTNAAPPGGPVDLWLAPSPTATPWGEPISPRPVQRMHTQRLQVLRQTEPASLAALKLPEGRVLWLTSGSRLGHEITAEWYAGVMAALGRHPDAHWVLVRTGAALPAFVDVRHPRVSVLGFQTDLGRLMLRCAVYLNPPRLGGGQSVAMAMAHGLPSLAMAGSDGGDKLGDAASVHLDDYFDTLDRWMSAPELRRVAADGQRQRFDEVLNVVRAGPSLVAALNEGVKLRAGG